MPKPDFSGEWTLNREASALSPVVAPVVQGGFVKIDHREPTVSVHLSINMDGKPFDARFQRSSEWEAGADEPVAKPVRLLRYGPLATVTVGLVATRV